MLDMENGTMHYFLVMALLPLHAEYPVNYLGVLSVSHAYVAIVMQALRHRLGQKTW